MFGAAELWLQSHTDRAQHQRDPHTTSQGFPYIREGTLDGKTGWKPPLASTGPPYLHLQLAGKVPLALGLWDSTGRLFYPPEFPF